MCILTRKGNAPSVSKLNSRLRAVFSRMAAAVWAGIVNQDKSPAVNEIVVAEDGMYENVVVKWGAVNADIAASAQSSGRNIDVIVGRRAAVPADILNCPAAEDYCPDHYPGHCPAAEDYCPGYCLDHHPDHCPVAEDYCRKPNRLRRIEGLDSPVSYTVNFFNEESVNGSQDDNTQQPGASVKRVHGAVSAICPRHCPETGGAHSGIQYPASMSHPVHIGFIPIIHPAVHNFDIWGESCYNSALQCGKPVPGHSRQCIGHN